MTEWADNLKEKLGEAIENGLGTGYTVSFRQVERNNGLRQEAVQVHMPGIEVGIDITDIPLLEKFKAGEISANEDRQKIAGLIKDDPDIKKIREIYERLDKPYILGRVTYQLINRELNAARLEKVPYKEVLDLAAVYKMQILDNESGRHSIVLPHAMCEKYGISEEELDSAAKKNMEGHFFVRLLDTFLAEMNGIPESKIEKQIPVYVFTNQTVEDGASILLYTEYFERLACEIRDRSEEHTSELQSH